MADDAIDAELAELRRSYARDLPAKARAVADAVAANDRDTALLLSHRLRGTAGSYAFHEVSVAAGKLEELLEAHADVASLERACTALCTAATAAAG